LVDLKVRRKAFPISFCSQMRWMDAMDSNTRIPFDQLWSNLLSVLAVPRVTSCAWSFELFPLKARNSGKRQDVSPQNLLEVVVIAIVVTVIIVYARKRIWCRVPVQRLDSWKHF